jgi:hypothetical protein
MDRKEFYKIYSDALKSGLLIKPEICSKCGLPDRSNKIAGHHNDYEKPLEVEWLCNHCHTYYYHNKKGSHWKLSEEQLEYWGKWNKGIVRSDEYKLNSSNQRKGKKLDEQWKKNISNGWHNLPETIKKEINKKKGHKGQFSLEHKLALSKALKGIKKSPRTLEHIKKLSIAKKLYWENKKKELQN